MAQSSDWPLTRYGSHADSNDPHLDRVMIAGTTVRLSGKFLANTGQRSGGEGRRRWLVVECDCSLCATGRFVAVDELSAYDPARPRHIARENLVIIGRPSKRDDP